MKFKIIHWQTVIWQPRRIFLSAVAKITKAAVKILPCNLFLTLWTVMGVYYFKIIDFWRQIKMLCQSSNFWAFFTGCSCSLFVLQTLFIYYLNLKLVWMYMEEKVGHLQKTHWHHIDWKWSKGKWGHVPERNWTKNVQPLAKIYTQYHLDFSNFNKVLEKSQHKVANNSEIHGHRFFLQKQMVKAGCKFVLNPQSQTSLAEMTAGSPLGYVFTSFVCQWLKVLPIPTA